MTLPELASHQVVATSKALERLRTYGGILLADEPGLGKSYVAAAVARVLSAQGFSVGIVVPASLVAQWRRTIDQFDIDALVQSHDSLPGDRSVPDTTKRLLIVDEAHAFRNPRTRRYDALARRSIGACLLLITATPLCNRAEDLASLLALIATDDALRAAGVPSIRRVFQNQDRQGLGTTLAELVIRRGRDILPASLHFGCLERRVIRHPVPEIPSMAQLEFPLLADGVSTELLRRLMIRRLESSEAALTETVIRQTRFYERALDALAGGRELTRREYRQFFAAGDERDAMQKILFWDLFAPQAARARPEELEQEIEALGRVRSELDRSPGVKLTMLVERLANDSTPALVFTEAVATAKSLFAALRVHRRTALATSRGPGPEVAIEAFRSGRADVLVATELASEGLDLQRAGVVVHYDIPWNPVRLDQRNGRAFRIGQRRPVVTGIYFLPERREQTSGVLAILGAKNRLRRGLLDRIPAGGEGDVADPSLLARRLALPRHVPRDAPEMKLREALRAARLPLPSNLLEPHRVGMERLLDQMAGEFLDRKRVCELDLLLAHESQLTGAREEGKP